MWNWKVILRYKIEGIHKYEYLNIICYKLFSKCILINLIGMDGYMLNIQL